MYPWWYWQAASKQARGKKSTSAQKQARDPRWSFNLKPTKWGPFETQGATIESRNVRNVLRNAESSMVGLGTRAVDIQRKMPRLQTTISENGNVVDMLTGTDLLSTINVPVDGAEAGDILFTQEISPSLFANSRLLQFSRLYQRYRFRKIQFLYEPIANATQSGQLLGFADFDVDNLLSVNSPANLFVGAAHQGQAITQIWDPAFFDMGQMFTFTDLYTEQGADEQSDRRLSIQGVFYLLAASTLSASLPLGNIYVDYEIEFSIPFLSTVEAITSRYSYQQVEGKFHQYPLDVCTVVDSANLGSFGPVTADYGLAGSSIQWNNLEVGDEVTVQWTAKYVAPAAYFPGSYGTRSLPTVSLTGGVLVQQVWLDYVLQAGEPFFIYFARLRASPIAGAMSVSIVSTYDQTVSSSINNMRLWWVMEPASSVGAHSMVVRRQSKRQQEMSSLRKQLADLSILVQGLSTQAVPQQSAVLVSRRPEPPLITPKSHLSHQLEFTHLGTRYSDGSSGKVHEDLSDSEDEEKPLKSRASDEVSRPLRRAGH